MTTQSFLYNAIFFTYGLVLTQFYDLRADGGPLYFFAFAVGNLLGPLVLGPALRHDRTEADDRGHVHLRRRPARDLRLALPRGRSRPRRRRPSAGSVVFFFASAGASAAYLTVSEIFPIEIRAQAIAVFFAIAQVFGAIGPVFYGALIGDGADPTRLYRGYLVAGP